MPEGPEIRRAADKVADAIVGQVAEDVFFAFDHLKRYEGELSGEEVTAVDTYGKAMLTRFANGLNVYSHNQLYGRWMIRPARDLPDTKRQLRFAIHNHKHSALLYSASDIEVLNDGEVDTHPFIRKIGPDLLRESTTLPQVRERFELDEFKRRRLYTLLLEQGFLAGLGNYLRSEILYKAGVHPKMRPVDCSTEQLDALAKEALHLTRQSYETRGITNDPKRVARLKKEGLSRRQYRHWVFNREDEECWRCGTPIEKMELGGRRIYICPEEQRLGE